jgi:hypothetical protein
MRGGWYSLCTFDKSVTFLPSCLCLRALMPVLCSYFRRTDGEYPKLLQLSLLRELVCHVWESTEQGKI